MVLVSGRPLGHWSTLNLQASLEDTYYKQNAIDTYRRVVCAAVFRESN